MKIKILKSNNKTTWYNDKINQVIDVFYDIILSKRCFTGRSGSHCLFNDDVVITELPESFCVKRCDDGIKWGKYIDWLNKTYNTDFCGRIFNFDSPYYGVINDEGWGIKIPFGTEIHIDDMIKHIDFYSEPMVIESKEEFDMSTNRGRQAYAIKYYPYGTKYRGLDLEGNVVGTVSKVTRTPHYNQYDNIDAGSDWIYIDKFNKWAEIINEVKEEKKMEKQKLSRQGLKEIHSVACTNWKEILEKYGTTNPLEDYIELTQEQVNNMFYACNIEQLPIVSKYLKKDDGSVDVTKLKVYEKGFVDGNFYIIRDREWGEYKRKSFLLSEKYNWEIKTDDIGQLCLIPTKKK